MTVVTNIRAVAPALPDVVGYVEAATADRLLGWAWAPGAPAQRASIELRLGDDIVAGTVADLLRPDLASNGIGDGRHAFELVIPPELRDRVAELRVFAQAAGSEPVAIGAAPVADGLSEQVTKLLRGVDMLLNSQRLIHRNLQTALTTQPAGSHSNSEPTTTALARMAEAQAATAEQLSAVERFVVRLDEQLSKLAPTAVKSVATTVPRAAVFALGIAGTALAVSVFGLIRSLGG